MTMNDCTTILERLGPFVDGELTGAERLAVSRHLECCLACEAELQAMRSLGDLMRAALPCESQTGDLSGLAAGVISRSRAEAAAYAPRTKPGPE